MVVLVGVVAVVVAVVVLLVVMVVVVVVVVAVAVAVVMVVVEWQPYSLVAARPRRDCREGSKRKQGAEWNLPRPQTCSRGISSFGGTVCL